MNKEDYAQFHLLLAKLKYELSICMYETDNKDYRDEIERHIKSIDDLMLVFLLEG
ncbi:MAG: hypothetical protein IJB83_02630 [Bacilli bacterium]|nr:hypothetical protein [Bacilli bacterium]